MRQAIVTKYRGPTAFSGSKITAKCQGGSVRVPYDYAIGVEGNHLAAAQRLVARMGSFEECLATAPWTWVGGQLPYGKSYAWVDKEG